MRVFAFSAVPLNPFAWCRLSSRSILDALGVYDPTITSANIRQAIDGNQLRMHYQPLVDVKTGVVRSVEALLRWEHPD